MPSKLSSILVKLGLLLIVAVIGGGFWYYTLGRKPKLVLSTPISDKKVTPATHLIGPGEVLLLSAGKATLFDTAAGKEKWSSNLEPPRAAATPARQRLQCRRP
jgi:hypothetical protein